jgi:hypothetical protein
VRVWLGGLKTDYREEFKPLDEMGPANVGALHRVFSVALGWHIGAALQMLAEHDEDVATALWDAFEELLSLGYGLSFEDLDKLSAEKKKPRKNNKRN